MINSHTHIFTIDHVPNYFGKRLIPVLGYVVSLQVAKRVYQFANWIYKGWMYVKRHVFLAQLIAWLFMWLLKRLGLTSFSKLLGKDSGELIARVARLADYALEHKNQQNLLGALKSYYPNNTRMVVLTMDMRFMGAGRPKVSYTEQLKEIEDINDTSMLPFLCIDPRRLMANDAERWSYNDYFRRLDSGKYMGLKLYPALGYYPFDWRMIPIFQHALKLGLPVMTHCSRGPVYYRGRWTKQEFGIHPFNGMELDRRPTFGNDRTHFSANFTHPLNYMILTNPQYLQRYLTNLKLTSAELYFVKENSLEEMFEKAPDLSQLKICLAHWGSGEEWDRYLTDYAFRPVDQPLEGLTSIDKFKGIWESYSWYSIIDHMISDSNYQFYTDVSFTLHDSKYLNLLKVSLLKESISHRVLFGTDFYVVSHKETEREFSIDVRGYIGEENWKRIADANPMAYLQSDKFPPV